MGFTSSSAEKNKALAQQVNIGGTINLLKLALLQYSINNTKITQNLGFKVVKAGFD